MSTAVCSLAVNGPVRVHAMMCRADDHNRIASTTMSSLCHLVSHAHLGVAAWHNGRLGRVIAMCHRVGTAKSSISLAAGNMCLLGPILPIAGTNHSKIVACARRDLAT
jgi:hypothetical protein